MVGTVARASSGGGVSGEAWQVWWQGQTLEAGSQVRRGRYGGKGKLWRWGLR